MKYTKPLNATDPDAPYWDAEPGRDGAYVPHEAVEHSQREIVRVIAEAGLTPSEQDLGQLLQAIDILIARRVEAIVPHLVGQYYWIEDEMPRPGLFPLVGGTVENFAATYPRMAAYLQTPYGQARLVTLDQWEALNVAIWATLADSSTVGWEGEGGVDKFVWDQDADTLLLPDLSGMTPVQISASLGVAAVTGDKIRNFTGQIVNRSIMCFYGSVWDATSGALRGYGKTLLSGLAQGAQGIPTGADIYFDASWATPTGNKTTPRSWGSLACVYLGLPVS
jgi:hypothetical protein